MQITAIRETIAVPNMYQQNADWFPVSWNRASEIAGAKPPTTPSAKDEDADVLDQAGSTKSPLFAKESYQEALTKIKTTKHSKKMKLPWRLSK